VVETRETVAGQSIAAICSIQAFPMPSYRLFLTFIYLALIFFGLFKIDQILNEFCLLNIFPGGTNSRNLQGSLSYWMTGLSSLEEL
jgi:hypothetical protein